MSSPPISIFVRLVQTHHVDNQSLQTAAQHGIAEVSRRQIVVVLNHFGAQFLVSENLFDLFVEYAVELNIDAESFTVCMRDDILAPMQVRDYTNVVRWADMLWQRPAVQRGRKVNRAWGKPEDQVPERHSAADFERGDESLDGNG